MAHSDDSDATADETRDAVSTDDDGSDRAPAGRRTGGETADDGSLDVAAVANDSVAVSLVFAAAGVGFGILVFLMAQFGGDATSLTGQPASPQTEFVHNLIDIGLTVAVYFPLFIAPITGLAVNFTIEDDLSALVAAAAGGFLGAVLFFMLAGITADLQYPVVQTTTGTVQGSFNPAVGFVNSVLIGFATAVVAGVSAVVGQFLQ